MTRNRATTGRTRTTWRHLAGLIGTAILFTACAGSDDPSAEDQPEIASGESSTDDSGQDDDPASDADTTGATTDDTDDAAPETDTPPDDETEVVEARFALPAVEPDPTIVDASGEPVDPLPPGTPEAVVDAGVTAGVWTEAEGLAVALQWFLGDLAPAEVPALDKAGTGSFSGIVERVDELLAAGEVDAPVVDELIALRDRVAPPTELLESLVAADAAAPPVDESPIQSLRAAPAQAASACVTVTARDFGDLDPGANCFATKTFEVLGEDDYRLRVFYPAEWQDTPEEDRATQMWGAMINTAQTIGEWAVVGDMDLVVGATDNAAKDLGLALRPPVGETCRITILPTGASSTGDDLLQLVAHETVHCLQFTDFGVGASAFVHEGGAEYFSHFLYPNGSLSDHLVDEFNADSLSTDLRSISYASWVWWQYLANRTSPQTVWELQRSISTGSALDAVVPDLEGVFHEFAIAWSGPRFTDSRGRLLPFQTGGRNRFVDGSAPLEVGAGQLVVARFMVTFAAERRYEPVRSDDGIAEVAWVEATLAEDRANWTETAGEIRTECDEPKRHIVVATSVVSTHSTRFDVQADPAACDPCLLDTWLIDLDSFESVVDGVIAAEARSAGIEAGAVVFELAGDYFVKFEENRWTSWREGYTTTVGGGGNTIVLTIASIEAGGYGADGSRISIRDATTIDSLATTSVGGLAVVVDETSASVGAFSIPVEGSEVTSPAGTYTCDEDRLSIRFDGYPADIVLDRVDDPPEPLTKLER